MIRVIDNVISDKYSQFLFDETVKLKWTFVPNLSYGTDDRLNNCGFSYTFFLDKNYNYDDKTKIISSEYNYVIPMLLEAFDKFALDKNIDDVFRSRARLTIHKQENRIEDKHIDYSFPHLVLLYYINTTDGDTILFEGDRIVERISPKRGRCVLFDGRIVHASSSSTILPRLVINNNILLNRGLND